jgi:hypothetical protein
LSEPVNDIISDMPEPFRRHARRGFAVAGSVSPAVNQAFFEAAARSISSGLREVDMEPLSKMANIELSQASALLAAFSALIGVIVTRGHAPDEFLRQARGELFEQEQEADVKALANLVAANANELRRRLERLTIAMETLPSLSSFDISIDLRLRFRNELVEDAATVALVHLDTDVENRELWFQMTRRDVEDLVERLTKALKQMDVAEKFYEAQSPK